MNPRHGLFVLLVAVASHPLALAQPDPRDVIVKFSALNGPHDPNNEEDEPQAGSGPLRITFADGHTQSIPVQATISIYGSAYGPQAGFEDIQLAPDHQTIGWFGEYNACAQSYPCALQLVVFRAGHIIASFQPDYGILWFWQFLGGGNEVAIQSGFPHGDATGEYKLYNVASGRLLQTYAGKGAAPDWVRHFADPYE